MNTKYFAAIDIGTNTLLLIISDENGKIVEDHHKIARLGEGFGTSKIIQESAIVRAEVILMEYMLILSKYDSIKIKAVATAALREAENSSYVLERLNKAIESDIEIISGNREASLCFKGSIESNEYSILIDIGGGSTEFIIGKDFNILERQSIPIGAVKITEMFLKHLPYNDDQIKKASEYILDELSFLDPMPFDGKCIAVAGTPTTLASIDLELKKYDPELIHNHKIELKTLYSIIHTKFKNSTREELIEKYTIDPNRADVITAGALILLNAMKYYNISSFYSSIKGLRYGVLKELMEN